MKDTFIIRTEWADAIFELDPLDQAQIFRNLFHFHNGEENLINLNNLTVKLVWKLIQPNLIRNIDSYDKRKETSSLNGKLGGRPKKEDKTDEKNLNNLNQNLNNLTEPNETLNVIDSVFVSDSVPVIDSENSSLKKETKKKKVEIEIKKIEGSEYGDGELHYLIDEYAKANHGKYQNDMYHLFLLYWTATVLNGAGKGKELWKTQTTFSLAGRLATWASKLYNNSNQNKQNGNATKQAEADKRGAELDELFKQYYAD